jgi:hypothetical protein
VSRQKTTETITKEIPEIPIYKKRLERDVEGVVGDKKGYCTEMVFQVSQE